MKSDDAPGGPVDLGPVEPAGAAEPAATLKPAATAQPAPTEADAAGNMLPHRERRRFGAERLLTRIIATCGIVGVGVLLGAILVSQKVAGWIDGLVIAGVTVILSAILWSSRQL